MNGNGKQSVNFDSRIFSIEPWNGIPSEWFVRIFLPELHGWLHGQGDEYSFAEGTGVPYKASSAVVALAGEDTLRYAAVERFERAALVRRSCRRRARCVRCT